MERGDLRRPSAHSHCLDKLHLANNQSNDAFYRAMSDEAVEKKQIIKIRTNQSVSLTASMTRPGPADTRNRFPLSTRVLGLVSAGILLSVVFC